MDKKSVYRNLFDTFRQSVFDPVNPFTIDNPDALVFNGRTLMGLYIPLKKEQSNPDLLLRRLFLSKLSLCGSVSTVLILPEEYAHAFDNYIEVQAAFDAVYVYENDKDLQNFLRNDIRQRTPIRPALRRQRMRRFWGTIEYIEKNGIVQNAYENQDARWKLRVNSWSNPNKVRYSKKTEYKHPFLVASKKRTSQTFKEGYEDLMTVTTMFNYTMSDGILRKNLEANDTFMYLNVEDVEDVLKNELNLRSMVFLGYLPGRIGNDYDLRGLRDHYYSFMKDKKYL